MNRELVNGQRIALAGVELYLRPSGALWLSSASALVVSDLHLGKCERNARRGGTLWPPYEARETLGRLRAAIDELDPDCVVALGDSFDDRACAAALDPETRAEIATLTAGRRWVWIAGNHDPAPHDLPGEARPDLTLGPLVLRHIAEAASDAEISGHFHPRAALRLRGRRVVRKCFLADANRVILPAFGTYTGGLDVTDPVFEPLIGPEGFAVLTGSRAVPVPLRDLRRLAA